MYFFDNILRFPRLESTNKKAKELVVSDNLREGSIVVCDEQYAGRGYSSNSWESQPGKNITATWILNPSFLPIDKQFFLTKVLSLAVKETVSLFYNGPESVTIKWPNDIYVADKKIAGILVENNIAGNTIKECFAGIGLNINQETFSSDVPNPVSIKMLTGNEYDIDKCVKILSEQIVHFYNILKSAESHKLDTLYSKNLYRIFEEAGFESAGKTFTGKIQGTDPYGRLIIMTNQGEIKTFDFKEVVFIL